MRSAVIDPSGTAPLRLLVTGAGGFVGQHLVDHVGTRWGGQIELIRGGLGETVDFDLSDPASVSTATADLGVDAVIHLAATSSVVEATEDVDRAWRVNVDGAAALAGALARRNPRLTFLFASSVEVYGDAFLDGIVSEQTVPRPRSDYGRSKLAAEQAIAAVLPSASTLGVVRPSNHIGPRQDERFAIASFAGQLAAGERGGRPVELRVGNLDVRRDFMDVRDVVRGYAALVAAARDSGERAVYNMATGTPRPIRDLLDRLRDLATIESRVAVDPARVRPSEIATVRISADRIRAEIGWEPRLSLEETLQAVMDDARTRAGQQT